MYLKNKNSLEELTNPFLNKLKKDDLFFPLLKEKYKVQEKG